MLHERLHKQVPAWTLVVVAVGVLMLVGIGAGLYNSGWAHGLTFGLLANGGDGGKLLAYQGYGGPHAWGHVGLVGGIFGGLLHFFFVLFFLGMIFKFLGFLRWRMHGMHGMQGNGAPGSQQPWGGPPWMRHDPRWQQPQAQQPQAPSEGQTPAPENKPQNTSFIV